MSPPVIRTLCFGGATNKRRCLVIEGDEVCFVSNIGRSEIGDECCAGVAIKRGYHHPGLYFLDAIKGPWTDMHTVYLLLRR